MEKMHSSESIRFGPFQAKRLLIVGNSLPFHVGHHFLSAAQQLGMPVSMCDVSTASSSSRFIQTMYWRFHGRRPVHLHAFGRRLIELCQRERPDLVLATGIAPLDALTLKTLGQLDIQCANFLTDDPWNFAHHAAWFLAALPHYHHIFTPRQSNMEDLYTIGCPDVHYLPFAYNPAVHYPDQPAAEAAHKLRTDIVFTGGADSDRLSWISALINGGFQVALYGNYWERHRITHSSARGQADLSTLRYIASTAKVNLCLVRRANRDGHVMRTFEVPAMGGCMLTEYTEEHQQLFGGDGETVVYFRSIQEMVEKLRWLLDNDDERQRLSSAVYIRITQGRHTYQDRLVEILERTNK